MVLAGTLGVSPDGSAIGTDGTSRSLVFPVAVSTRSYASRVHLVNVDEATVDATISYHGSPGTDSAGERVCYTRRIPPLASADFDLNALCGLGPGKHYGLLRVNGSGFLAGYSRVSNPQGNGFSVEAYPAGQFFGSALNVLGLRKSATAPGYTTNCFVAGLDEPAGFSIRLYGPTGEPLGAPVTGTVGANELLRLLDIFAAAGVPGNEHADVRAEIHATQGATPALVGFCTVQNNTDFDADFRIGKSRGSAGADVVKAFTGLVPTEALDGPVAHRFATIVAAPDVIDCSIDGAAADLLEMRLLGPDGKVKAGGPLAGGFSAATGARGLHTRGEDGVWVIEVRARSTTGPFLLSYSLGCRSGNGMTQPLQLADGSRGVWTEPVESEGTLAAGVRLLDQVELAGVASETETEVVLASTSALQAGDVFVTPNGAYKVVLRTDAGDLATLVVIAPALEEVFARLRIRDGSAVAPSQGTSLHKSDSIDVELGEGSITATFNLSDGGVSGSGGFTVQVDRWHLDTDLDFADLFDPDVRKSAVLELDLTMSANLSLAYTGGEEPLERLIGKVRIPIRTSLLDAVTGVLLGRTAIALVIPVSIVLDANVSANATGTATLKSRFTYSPASGPASAIAGTGSFAFGPPGGGAVAIPGASLAAFLMLRVRPALGFFDPVALLGLDLQGGAELEGKVDATTVSPYYCAKLTPYARFSAAGFFSTVGLSDPITTPTLVHRHSLAEFLGAPLQVGGCTPPPLPPSLAGLSCSLETDARGDWRWTLGGTIEVDPPISAGDQVGLGQQGWISYDPGSQMTAAFAEVSRDCGSLVPTPNPARCAAVTDSMQPATVTVKMATSMFWFCGVYPGQTQPGCWGPFGPLGTGFTSPLSSGDPTVVRNIRAYVYRTDGSGGSLTEGVLNCPDPPRIP